MKISVDLLRQCRLENRPSQKELYLQLLPYIKAVCERYIIKKSELKDVLQEAFVLIFKKIDQFDSSKGNFHNWAARIAINATFNYNKRVSVLNEDEFQLNYHDKGLEPEIYKNMSDQELMLLLNRMPKLYYEVFNLSIIDCYEHHEISKLLGISKAVSRKRLSRARYWLQNKLLEDLNNESVLPHPKTL